MNTAAASTAPRNALANDLGSIMPANAAFLAKPRKLLIDGEWVAAASGKTFEVRDPSSDQVIAHCALGDAADIDRAVAAARRAFEAGDWAQMKPVDRERVLHKLADLIEKHADELAELESIDNGKSVVMARHVDIKHALEVWRYMAGWPTKLEGKTLPLSGTLVPGQQYAAFSSREPIGVVGAVIAWNFPFVLATWKCAPALAAGCTVVLKPAEETPLTALRLGELALEAGFPKGVLNIVTGMGPTAGAALSAHPDVDKITFTGSTEVGRLIVQAAAGNMKKVTVELGGKSPSIILQDADLDVAIPGAASAIFFNQGQVCSAGSRLYVAAQHFDRVVAGIADQAKSMKVGPGLDPTAQIGPLVSSIQRERVTRYLNDGAAGGASAARPAAMRSGSGCRADGVRQREPANVRGTGGDLRAGRGRAALRGHGRYRAHRQRFDLRAGGQHLGTGRRQDFPARAQAARRHGLGELPQRARCDHAVRRLQAVGVGPGTRRRGGLFLSRE